MRLGGPDGSGPRPFRQSGVDALVFGNSKLGGALSEAVVFFSVELAAGFRARIKQAGQLMSKGRFYTAPWHTMLTTCVVD